MSGELIRNLKDLELLNEPGTEVDRPRLRTMVLIQVSRTPGGELTLDWLLSVLPSPAAAQLEEAVLVIATDPNARLLKVLKNESDVDEYLEVHTAALG